MFSWISLCILGLIPVRGISKYLLTAIIGYSEILKMKGSLDTDSGHGMDEEVG
ncbi:MAG: hypothetical protein KAR18_05585 [Spirochaetes bacterium]|nr:hypothetical protein [Spirochaetota bacterium]